MHIGKWLLALAVCCVSAAASAEKVALVIGNAAYEVGRLNSPVNDAVDVGATLRSVGFEVVEARDASREDMLRALAEFRTKIRPGGLAVAYYSGHGVEVEGQNWLLPVRNAVIRTQADVPIYSVSAQDVLRKMEEGGARLNFLILDACRDNPLPSGVKSASKGLGRMDTGTSTLVAYATSPGKTAADGTGRNSPYTAVLKEALKTPGLSVTDLVNQVGAQVQQLTGGAQVPWNSGTPIWPPVMLAGAGVVLQPSPEMAPTEGELRIEVSPATAMVRLDGVLLGTGSRSVREPAGKTVLVRVEADGHDPWEDRVRVQGGQVADVKVRLSARPATTSSPTESVSPAGSTQVRLATTLGDVVIRLRPDIAPESSARFLSLARSGHYTGTIFHRVIPGFMAQGGGYSQDLQLRPSPPPIKNEADREDAMSNLRGTVAMARTADPHSATSQFFINVVDNPRLNFTSRESGFTWGYCVFGEVVQGMDVVDAMVRLPTGGRGPLARDVPQQDVVIRAVSVE
jgi:cyclophilin family peptidyl-prolyl cis-trans isomerase